MTYHIEKNPVDFKNPSDAAVYNNLREESPLRLQDLVARTGLAQTTVFDALERLLLRELIIKWFQPQKRRGHPPAFYELPPQAKSRNGEIKDQ